MTRFVRLPENITVRPEAVEGVAVEEQTKRRQTEYRVAVHLRSGATVKTSLGPMDGALATATDILDQIEAVS